MESISNNQRYYTLIQRAINGDTTAFDLINEGIIPSLDRVAMAILHDREDAENVRQEALIAAWKNLGKFKKGKDYLPWVKAIVRNIAIDHFRKNKQTPSHPSCCVTVEADLFEIGLFGIYDDRNPRQQASKNEFLEIIYREIEKLPPKMQEVIKLHVRGDSVKEISEKLGLKESAVTTQISKGMKRLRKNSLQNANKRNFVEKSKEKKVTFPMSAKSRWIHHLVWA